MEHNSGSTVLVTGASTGMGEAAVDHLTRRGFTVHAVARDTDKLQALAERTGAIVHSVDLSDVDSIEQNLSSLEIDILINNAGVSAEGNILNSSRSTIDAMVDVNIRAVLHLCRLLLPGMVKRNRGHIVNISSIAGHYNFFGHTAYHATKSAVHQLSRQLRNDTLGRRIRVTEIAPGRVETEIFGRNLGGTPEAMEEARKTFFEGYESLTTSDIVDAMAFALDAAPHTNIGLIEITPTFQVPGGLTFERQPSVDA